MKKYLIIGSAISALAVTACGEQTLKTEADSAQPAKAAAEATKAKAEPKPKPEPKPASLGDAITLEAGPDRVRVQLTGITDAIEPKVDPYLGEAMDRPTAGSRYLGATLKVTNLGDKPFDPTFAGTGALIMADDTPAGDAILMDSPPWSDDSTAKVSPGATLTLNVPYEAPTKVKPGRFQYTLSGATLDEATAEWKL